MHSAYMHCVTNEAIYLLIVLLLGVLVHFLFNSEKKTNQKKRRKGREITSFPPLDPSRLLEPKGNYISLAQGFEIVLDYLSYI